MIRNNKAKLAFDMLEKEMEVLSLQQQRQYIGGLHFNNYQELANYITQYGVTNDIANKSYTIGTDGLNVTNLEAMFGSSSVGYLADLVINNIMSLNNQPSSFADDNAFFSYIASISTGGGFTPLPVGNGYCVFNAYSYLLFGSADKANLMFDIFKQHYANLIDYNTDGTVKGINPIRGFSSGVNVYNEITNIGNSLDQVSLYFRSDRINLNDPKIDQLLSAGTKLYAEIKESSTMSHALVLLEKNQNGSYEAWDPTNQKFRTIYPADIKYVADVYSDMMRATPPGSTGGSDAGSTGGSDAFYGSSGLISTGFDNDTYWENFYVYEENGPYTAGDTSWGHAALNYSTGYNYSTGNSTGTEQSTGN